MKFFEKFYKLMGSPVKGVYVKWYKYLIPKRLTLKENPPIYCWLGFNFVGNNNGYKT